ncbi:MAG: sensor domain-containing diguanylate cyclase, partial [Campylobacterota bacterium]|nr:sensor domain-containing diguanylate cyclase [Campylobacterota bacterium]
QKIIEENSRYIKTVIDTIADPTVVIDVKSYEVVLYNRAAKELYLGQSEDIPSTIKCHQLSHSSSVPCEGSDDPCPIAQILATKQKTRVTHKHYKGDGTHIYVELIAIPILDEKGNVVQIIESQRDISHHLEYEESLKELATRDKLTNTYNRTKFDEILQHSFQKSKENLHYFGLIMFDIDHFKRVNDTYGHDVGDSVLIEITALVKEHIRKNDILVRWGGEEFIIYIPDSDIKILQRISEYLRSCVEKYDFKDTHTITASFGATMLKEDDSIESLIKRVDRALYTSKHCGRNRVTAV